MPSFENAPERALPSSPRPLGGGEGGGGAAGLVAASPRMRALLREAERVAPFDAPVLIEGETGSGKELLARFVHDRSARRGRPLVAVNCAAIPDELLEAEFFGHARGAFTGAAASRPGLVEAADGGSLFLDEVGELSARAQSLLLRVLQEREYRRVGEVRVRRSDFRLIAATHRHLGERAAAGEFRSDLFYRLCVVRLELPPLRERRDELGAIAEALLARLARRFRVPPPRLSEDALATLAAREWPGNIRELESSLAGAILRHPGVRVIESAMLGSSGAAAGVAPAAHAAAPPTPAEPAAERPGEPGPEPPGESSAEPSALAPLIEMRRLAVAAAAFERLVLLHALRRTAGSRVRAARELGITRQGLWRKLRRHGIA